MAMEGLTTCAVGGCTLPLSSSANLCDEHRLPGQLVRVGNSTMVVTIWVAHHEGDVGIIYLNDFALGDLFAGRPGFEKCLRDQGFTRARLIRTREEPDAEAWPNSKRQLASWSGPWKTTYPWEKLEQG